MHAHNLPSQAWPTYDYNLTISEDLTIAIITNSARTCLSVCHAPPCQYSGFIRWRTLPPDTPRSNRSCACARSCGKSFRLLLREATLSWRRRQLLWTPGEPIITPSARLVAMPHQDHCAAYMAIRTTTRRSRVRIDGGDRGLPSRQERYELKAAAVRNRALCTTGATERLRTNRVTSSEDAGGVVTVPAR